MKKVINLFDSILKSKKIIYLILLLSLFLLPVNNIRKTKENKIESYRLLNDEKIYLERLNQNKKVLTNFVADTNPVAEIKISNYTWDSLTETIETVSFNSTISFTIDQIVPLNEIQYYISSIAIDPLDLTTWSNYTGKVDITNEGFYIVYVKTKDTEGSVSYLNTDLLILDKSGSDVTISVENNSWDDLRNDLDYVYIDREESIIVEADDNLSGVSEVKYYITDELLTITDLNLLSSSNWLTYNTEVNINQIGKNIVYIKVVDNANNISYVNTDVIVLDGYSQNNFIVGRDNNSYIDSELYITNKSIITFDISYSLEETTELIDYTHNLVSNIMLPVGTKITMIDKVNERIYKLNIDTETNTIPFTLFYEIGNENTIYYVEDSYFAEGIISENFTFSVDFSSVDIVDNYSNVNLYLELYDLDGNNVRPTLYDTIEEFNIYSNINEEDTKSILKLTTNYADEITLESATPSNIEITSWLDYKKVEEFEVIDTEHENKEMGLSIRLVDSEGNIVVKEHLKNIIFKVGNSIYYPETDNIIRINLKSGISKVTKTIEIITGDNDTNLKDGTYYLKISNYTSYDGYYYDELGLDELSIKVNVPKRYSGDGFDVKMDGSNHIIRKKQEDTKIMFDILQAEDLKEPSIRISLYKKNSLTAYNQDYTIIDLKDYMVNDLVKVEDNVYSITNEPIRYTSPDYLYNNFELNLITENLENNGYKFVFDLYDGNKKIGTINKYFIVKEV